ncbi:hypothetical protein PoB_007266500 [Plakobranchus ocellatus]|uniref:Uncharacterized protein n=1 Tax=Plakobranchus ocellatus TaxID=259542 RepID=A0AAV4DQE2_9GAST|nr:hypothetical protein PoB_007266500 [Plakobranchus ocellatus]
MEGRDTPEARRFVHGYHDIKHVAISAIYHLPNSRTISKGNEDASPAQRDVRLSGTPSGKGARGGTRTQDGRVPADLRAASLSTVIPMLSQ